MPRGGARTGSGRKRKALGLKVLHGTASQAERAARTAAGNQTPAPEIKAEAGNQSLGQFEPPVDLTERQQAIWRELAPHAIGKKTLVAETFTAFRMLCSQIALMRAIEAELEQDGLTGQKVTLQMDESGGGLQSVEKKAHTLLPKLTTVMQRVEAGLVRFGIAPTGKPMVEDKPVEVDPFAVFEVVQGGKQ
jgi:phage terminase small subunit